MKKARIKNINIHAIPITDKKKNEIDFTASKIYARYISKTLDSMTLSNQNKIKIIKEILKLQ